MKKLLIFTFIVCLSTLVVAQEDKYIKKGDLAFDQKNYSEAFINYELAYKSNNQNAHVNLRLAQLYLITSPKQKSLSYAGVAVRSNKTPTSEYYFTYAQALHINHRWDSAIYYYNKSDLSKSNTKIIAKKVMECQTGKQLYAAASNCKITNMGSLVNSKDQDYLPYATADLSKLYFTSRRSGSTGGKIENDGLPFEDIYVCSNVGGAWSAPKNVGSPINSEIHDACIGLSEDGQTMFIYRGSNGGDIYTSELKGNQWTKPEPIVAINTEFFESSVSISPDERTLFFTRAMNAYSARDIYMCSKGVGGNWSKPVKCMFNTEFDEDAPFMHPDGKTLYFSSKGNGSMGGYDVFKVTRLSATGNVWSKPTNIGAPINTALDDVYFSLSADGKVGLYASDQEGGYGKQDLYSIRFPVNTNAPELTLLKGTVLDATTGKAIEAQITVADNTTKEIVATHHSNSATGEFLIALPSGKNYAVTIEKEGKLFYSENVQLNNGDGFKELTQKVILQSAKAGSKIVLNNIFFDSGSDVLRTDSYIELQKLIKTLTDNPSLKIEISGHTDNIGNEESNLLLSEKRALAVKNYLIQKGISASRIVAKGYGSSAPIDNNQTESGRQKNRRTEMKIL